MSDENLEPPSVNHARPGRRKRRRPTIFEALCVGGILFLIVLILPPSFERWRDSQGSTPPCGRHLRQLGQAMLLYSMDHGGRWPISVEDLLCEDITTAIFVCPYSGDTVAKAGPTTRATAANVLSGHHLSYVIHFEALNAKQDANVVIAYEPLSNHQNVGTNVLYGDGHVDFIAMPEAAAMIAEVEAGHNPPRPEILHPSASTTRATTIPAR